MKTTKLGLKKPDGTDLVNIQDFNENVEEIEKQLEQRPTKAGDASDMTATFTQASKVAQLTSGESIKASFGKIAKTIADYMSHKTTTATVNILGHVKFGTDAGTACQGNDSRLSDNRMPKTHASSATTYGIGTTSNYGHVKLSDTFNSAVANGSAVNGMAASQQAVAGAYTQLNGMLHAIGTINITDAGTITCSKSTGKTTNLVSTWLEPGTYMIKGVVSANPSADGLLMRQIYNETADETIGYILNNAMLGGKGIQRMEIIEFVTFTEVTHVSLRGGQSCDTTLPLTGKIETVRIK